MRARIGSLDQVAAVEEFVVDNEPGRGSRRWRLTNGSGLEVDVLPDRCFDIGRAVLDGRPIAWCSPAGFATSARADDTGTRWLRTFGGGLLATCGLDTFGPPSSDRGEEYPLHGRVGSLPGRAMRADVTPHAVDAYVD